MEWDASQIEHREDVGVADFVLQREAKYIEITERSEGFPAVEWNVMRTQGLFKVDPRCKRSLASPVVTLIHQVVQDFQAMMTHPNGIRIRKSQAECTADFTMVFLDRVQFAAHVLSGTLDLRQDPLDNGLLSFGVSHATQIRFLELVSVARVLPYNGIRNVDREQVLCPTPAGEWVLKDKRLP